MSRQTVESIRRQIAGFREEERNDPSGYLKALPDYDPRIFWRLRKSLERTVLELYIKGREHRGRIGFIQTSRELWHGAVFVDGEMIFLDNGERQPSRISLASHLYSLALELLNTEEDSNATVEGRSEVADGEGVGAGEDQPAPDTVGVEELQGAGDAADEGVPPGDADLGLAGDPSSVEDGGLGDKVAG